MKKLLLTAIISLMVTSTAMAAETYTEGLLNSFQKKVNDKAAPVVNTEKQIRAQQQALNPQNNIQNVQAQQQDLINKKRQQIQAQKDALKQQQQGIKDIFTIK